MARSWRRCWPPWRRAGCWRPAGRTCRCCPPRTGTGCTRSCPAHCTAPPPPTRAGSPPCSWGRSSPRRSIPRNSCGGTQLYNCLDPVSLTTDLQEVVPTLSVLFWLHTSSPRPSAWPQSLSRALHPQYLVPFTCQSASPEHHHYYHSTHDGQKYKTHIDTVRSCRSHGRSRSPRPPCTCPPARCCPAPPWNTGTALLHNTHFVTLRDNHT